MEDDPKSIVFWASTATEDHATYSKTRSRRQKGDTPPESRTTPGLRRSPPEHDWNGEERRESEPKGTKGRRWLGGFRLGLYKKKRREKEGRWVGHTARSDQSGHDLSKTQTLEWESPLLPFCFHLSLPICTSLYNLRALKLTKKKSNSVHMQLESSVSSIELVIVSKWGTSPDSGLNIGPTTISSKIQPR